MEDKEFDRNMFGMVTNSDGSIKMCCGVIPMIGILIAVGSALIETTHIF
jgi:hypothetical protein